MRGIAAGGGGVAPWDPHPPRYLEALGAGGGGSGAGDPAGAAWLGGGWGGGRLPGKGPIPTSPGVQTSGPLPGGGGRSLALSEGAHPSLEGSSCSSKAHLSAQWTSTLPSRAQANSPGRDPVPLSVPGHGTGAGGL